MRLNGTNCWWQKSDIWSQASYRYTILWVAFLDPSDSYFLFADLVGFYTHWTYMHIFRQHFSQQLLMAEIWHLITSFILIKWNWRSANWMTCIEHEKENIPFDIVPWCSLLVIQKLWSLSMYPTILHVCVSLPFPSTWKFFCINMASLQLTQVGFYSY